jgi:hypothetical protein
MSNKIDRVSIKTMTQKAEKMHTVPQEACASWINNSRQVSPSLLKNKADAYCDSIDDIPSGFVAL